MFFIVYGHDKNGFLEAVNRPTPLCSCDDPLPAAAAATAAVPVTTRSPVRHSTCYASPPRRLL